MKKKYIILIAVAAVLVVLSVMTSFLKSISGTVIDSETGRPVENAVVLVEWTRRQGIGDYHTVSVRTAETITDKEGKFHVFGPLHSFVDPPDVTIYKKGYVAWNSLYAFPTWKKRADFVWKEQSLISLEPFRNEYSRSEHVYFLHVVTHWGKLINEAYRWEELEREKQKCKSLL